jgi:Uma2 family endonuclease
MEWHEVIEHPSLRDLPFKIETNKWGQIVMTPATVMHSKYQGLIIESFHRLGQWGRVFPELGIQTSDGVKVADVAWGSAEFFRRNEGDVPCLMESPEIVVEVRSPSNTAEEMEGKKKLYFEKGAKEVWFCDKEGSMHFFNPQGKLKRSELFGEFPEHIDIDFT